MWDDRVDHGIMRRYGEKQLLFSLSLQSSPRIRKTFFPICLSKSSVTSPDLAAWTHSLMLTMLNTVCVDKQMEGIQGGGQQRRREVKEAGEEGRRDCSQGREQSNDGGVVPSRREQDGSYLVQRDFRSKLHLLPSRMAISLASVLRRCVPHP